MHEPTSLLESVTSSFRDLSSAASELNLVSDALSKAVSDIDEGLKKLNLGITSWVRIEFVPSDLPESDFYEIEELGYTKLNGRWGVSLRKRTGEDGHPQVDELVEVWPYNEAPRMLRLKAIEKIPVLLKELSGEANKTTKALSTRLADAQTVAAVLNPPKPMSSFPKRIGSPRSHSVITPLPNETSGMLAAHGATFSFGQGISDAIRRPFVTSSEVKK